MIFVICLLLSGNAYAVPVNFEELNHNINYLVKDGYKITFVNYAMGADIYYTLEKDNNVVICLVQLNHKNTHCYKP